MIPIKLQHFVREYKKVHGGQLCTPEPWDMPGYSSQVIMAAGAFVQGASIELSADAPIKPPYIAYMQGGLTYESAKLGIMVAADKMLRKE